MPDKIKAAVLHKPGDIRIEMVDMPTIKPDEVLVKIMAVGVCGSDVHYYKTGRIGPYVVEKPMILGHECSGQIVEVGEEVKGLKVGDRVALEPGIPCRKCVYCKTGRYNLCPDVVFMATPPVDGAFVEYVSFPADFANKLPDNMTYEEGAMMEPLAVGVYAAQRGGVKPGDKVAVLGAGPIGLVTLQAAKARGATQVFASDVAPNRLEMAEKLGATAVINAKVSDTVEEIHRLTGGQGVDVVFETAGTVPTTQQTMKVVKRGGVVVIIGLPAEDVFPMSMMEVVAKELDVRGIFRYANIYPSAIELVTSGQVDVKSLITHTFTLEQTQEALEFAHERKDISIKSVIKIG